MQEPLDHLPDCNYYHYALQLNIYPSILESEYNIHVSGMFLGIFHPSRTAPMCVQIPPLDDEMRLLSE